jgi:hypothetical protein
LKKQCGENPLEIENQKKSEKLKGEEGPENKTVRFTKLVKPVIVSIREVRAPAPTRILFD